MLGILSVCCSPQQSTRPPSPRTADFLNERCAALFYPDAMRRTREGTVVLRAQISETGCMERVGVVESSGASSLDEAAMKWIEQVSFHPASKNSQPQRARYASRSSSNYRTDVYFATTAASPTHFNRDSRMARMHEFPQEIVVFSGFLPVDYVHQRANTLCMALRAERFDGEMIIEERVARLESDVHHIRSDIAEVKTDIRRIDAKIDAVKDSVVALDNRIQAGFAAVDRKFAELEMKMLEGFANISVTRVWDRLWMLMIAAGLLGIIARVFKWI